MMCWAASRTALSTKYAASTACATISARSRPLPSNGNKRLLALRDSFSGQPAQINAGVVFIDRREAIFRRGDEFRFTMIATDRTLLARSNQSPVADAVAG